jgi:Asp-tRNA(Asn)/Glu-tRNA(Gln) amidotransferase A subunit family amidase
MTDRPWPGDACSLVEDFRAGGHSPFEEMQATVAAIERSTLNAFCYLDADRALERAAKADVSAPLGGVPLGVKELDRVIGWPAADASLLFAQRRSEWTSTCIQRAEAAGAIAVGQTVASEFGGLNVSVSKLHGVTANAWDRSRSAGGSSGGSATAVAGGLVSLASGSDGGGSIRIPAGFCGLVGMKGTFGRLPRGPHTLIAPGTVVNGCLCRSVRDVARYFDAVAGVDRRDPASLPSAGTWEANLGRDQRRGLRMAVLPDFSGAVISDEMTELISAAGEALVAMTGAVRLDVTATLPSLTMGWAMSNMGPLLAELGEQWPARAADMTLELQFALALAEQTFNLAMAAEAETARTRANEAMAAIFDQVDVIVCATNPDVAFPAEVTLNTRVGDRVVSVENNGALTVPANIYGAPAISLPAGSISGLPAGMQLIAAHHRDDLLLDLGARWERERPWPLVVPGSPL